jgi:hypothetical protein
LATEEKEGSKLSEMEEHFGQWRRPGFCFEIYFIVINFLGKYFFLAKFFFKPFNFIEYPNYYI